MTLAEALDPLYRGYLRRLEEMASRLPPGAAITERTARGEGGKLVSGGAGLPLRFDVADARDGHAYEVHGARPDEPLAAEAKVARLDVRLLPGNWEELPVVCAFASDPAPEDVEELADLVRAFCSLAWHGAFAGARADRWLGRAHGLRIELRERELWAILDLGTCPPAALEALCAALSAFGEDRVPLAYARIGGKA